MTSIKWGRSDEGFVESKCGRFEISPEYWGCVQPQSYTLIDVIEHKQYRQKVTQKDCKALAKSIVKLRSPVVRTPY
jgi:hypothetical protein